MTNDNETTAIPSPLSESTPDSDAADRDPTPGRVRFAMIALYVEDLQRSVDFYRLVGLDLPDPQPGRPVVNYREDGTRRMIIATGDVARRFDPHRTSPRDAGYRQVIEFFVDGDHEVDAAWRRLTDAGFTGISSPSSPNGTYTTLDSDPDGNVVMITHDL